MRARCLAVRSRARTRTHERAAGTRAGGGAAAAPANRSGGARRTANGGPGGGRRAANGRRGRRAPGADIAADAALGRAQRGAIPGHSLPRTAEQTSPDGAASLP